MIPRAIQRQQDFNDNAVCVQEVQRVQDAPKEGYVDDGCTCV